jgi:hypothetical protein
MIESVITAYLAGELNISVSGLVPSPMPEKFVTVEKTGSSTEDKVRRATLAIDSWAPDQETAALLNEEVIAAMYAAVTLPQISEVQCETDYNFTDTKTRKARYSAIFGVVYFDD